MSLDYLIRGYSCFHYVDLRFFTIIILLFIYFFFLTSFLYRLNYVSPPPNSLHPTVGGAHLATLLIFVNDYTFYFQGNNSAYSLRLEDVSGAFAVEPISAVGTTAVIIRLMNNSLDYENPNLRKFIILVSNMHVNCQM